MASTFKGPFLVSRGTKARLDELANIGALIVHAVYYTTDTRRLHVAVTTSTYVTYVRSDELGPQNRVVTQAEYDALTTEQKNDPKVVYLIREA